jgi:hypothetical protein
MLGDADFAGDPARDRIFTERQAFGSSLRGVRRVSDL